MHSSMCVFFLKQIEKKMNGLIKKMSELPQS